MVALNVQCSMFNGESSLQLPARSIAAATLVVATLGDVPQALRLGLFQLFKVLHVLSEELRVKSEELLRSPRLIVELAGVLSFND